MYTVQGTGFTQGNPGDSICDYAVTVPPTPPFSLLTLMQAVCCHSCKKSTKKPAKITKPPIKSDAAHGFGLDNVMTGGVLVAVLIRSHLH